MRAVIAALLLCATQVSTATLGDIVVTAPRYALRLTGVASWYHLPGRQTASGARYGGNGVAHRTLPFGSRRTLCREDRPLVCVEVVVVDRGPFVAGRDWDLSRSAARKLGMIREGIVNVTIHGGQ